MRHSLVNQLDYVKPGAGQKRKFLWDPVSCVRWSLGLLPAVHADTGRVALRAGRPEAGQVAGLVDHLGDGEDRVDAHIDAEREVGRRNRRADVVVAVVVVWPGQHIGHRLLLAGGRRGNEWRVFGVHGTSYARNASFPSVPSTRLGVCWSPSRSIRSTTSGETCWYNSWNVVISGFSNACSRQVVNSELGAFRRM